MKKVIEESLFVSEHAKESLSKIDFSDTFSTTNHKDSIEEIANQIFNTPPKWVVALLKFRNFLVKFIGLKTTKPEDYNTEYRIGGYVGFFKIYIIEKLEVILGANDSHLNFRVLIANTKEPTYNIKVTTLVEYNNKMGKVYMAIVKPFHRVVIKSMIRKSYSNVK